MVYPCHIFFDFSINILKCRISVGYPNHKYFRMSDIWDIYLTNICIRDNLWIMISYSSPPRAWPQPPWEPCRSNTTRGGLISMLCTCLLLSLPGTLVPIFSAPKDREISSWSSSAEPASASCDSAMSLSYVLGYCKFKTLYLLSLSKWTA